MKGVPREERCSCREGRYGARIVAVRGLGGARLRRAARGRAGVAGLAVALYLGAGLLATSPTVFETDHFLGYGAPRDGRVTPGDHLQTAYNLWLPGHQLARGEAPWLDPYSFQPEVEPRVNFAGWPFAAVFGPLHALVRHRRRLECLHRSSTYVGAGRARSALAASAWAPARRRARRRARFRAGALSRRADRPGICSVRSRCSFRSRFYGVERSRGWLAGAAAALVSIPLSGQVHLALGRDSVRARRTRSRAERPWLGAVAARAPAWAAAPIVWALSRVGDAAERPFSRGERYSATLGDLVTARPDGFEQFVYLGWLRPSLALAGLGCLCFRNTISSSRGSRSCSGSARSLPFLLALGRTSPATAPLAEYTSACAPRVPERMLPIACLCLAALRRRSRSLVFQKHKFGRGSSLRVAAVLVAADLRVPLYDPLNADEGKPVTARLRPRRPDACSSCRLLPPERHAGSVYLYDAMQAPRERPLGYSTAARPVAFRAARQLPAARRNSA